MRKRCGKRDAGTNEGHPNLGLVKSLQQRSSAVGTRTAQGIATYWARLEPLSPTQICDEV